MYGFSLPESLRFLVSVVFSSSSLYFYFFSKIPLIIYTKDPMWFKVKYIVIFWVDVICCLKSSIVHLLSDWLKTGTVGLCFLLCIFPFYTFLYIPSVKASWTHSVIISTIIFPSVMNWELWFLSVSQHASILCSFHHGASWACTALWEKNKLSSAHRLLDPAQCGGSLDDRNA